MVADGAKHDVEYGAVSALQARLRVESVARFRRLADDREKPLALQRLEERDRLVHRRLAMRRVEAVDAEHLIRPEHLHFWDRHPPVADIGDLAGQREHRVAVGDLALRRADRGHIHEDAEDRRGLAGRVELAHAARDDVDDLAISALKARLEMEILAGGERTLHAGDYPRTVLLDIKIDRFGQARRVSGAQPVDLEDLVGPHDRERLDVEPPMAEVGHLARDRQRPVAAFELAAGPCARLQVVCGEDRGADDGEDGEHQERAGA